jgi:hypothetical protein
MSDKKLPASLEPTASDRAVQGLQAITSAVDMAVPGVGSFFGALVGQIIPNQRNERLVEYCVRLGRRLQVAEGAVEDLRARLEALAANLTPEQLALFEDGAAAAVKATSEDRVDTIARIVAAGLTNDDAKAADQRRLLDLLNELSDEDVVVLCSYTHRYGRDPGWRELHKASLSPVAVHMQSSEGEMDQGTMRDIRKAKLVRLRVLEEKPSSNGRSTSTDLTRIGRFVLRHLGLIERQEF